jgi:hypothetical protein
LFFWPLYDFALVHRLSDKPSPFPCPCPSSLDTLAPLPLRDSLDGVLKRLIAPNVRISSVGIFNPGVGDDERRRKGLSKLLGFDVQLDPFLWEGAEDDLGVVWSHESGRVDVDVLREAAPHGGDAFGWRVDPLKHDEDKDGDLETSIGG